jgi:hypothetical protein
LFLCRDDTLEGAARNAVEAFIASAVRKELTT